MTPDPLTPPILTPEHVEWIRNRISQKDDLVVNWLRVLDSHEALRAEVASLWAENDKFRAALAAMTTERATLCWQ